VAVSYRTIDIEGHQVFHREAGDEGAPKIALFGGFPSSSYQWRNLAPALAERGFHVASPDYPGFGHTQSPASFKYTFDNLSEVIEKWLIAIGFTSFGLFFQDYGGPIGNRIVGRHPEWMEWMGVQNSNAYDEGFRPESWDATRKLWENRNKDTEEALLPFLQADGVKSIYLTGHSDPELISPDNWTMDTAFLDLPGRRTIQLDLLEDYKTNLPLYTVWHQFMQEHQPRTIIFWGQGDVFFVPAGGEAFLRDLPDAELHPLDSGHFAVEDKLTYMVDNIERFYREKVAGPAS
jgi:pimeloyl-ACP methyl ester carboxylesterase